MKKITKGWKVFNSDLSCRGFQFEIGRHYHQDFDKHIFFEISGFMID
jgi:hypothetical protein